MRGSAFKSPAALVRIRAQAEKVFDDAISSSIFTSPSMQRIKRQTDTMFAEVSKTFTGLAVVKDVKTFFTSWFG